MGTTEEGPLSTPSPLRGAPHLTRVDEAEDTECDGHVHPHHLVFQPDGREEAVQSELGGRVGDEERGRDFPCGVQRDSGLRSRMLLESGSRG